MGSTYNLKIVFDTGASLTKLAACVGEGSAIPLCMGPEVFELQRDLAEQQDALCDSSCPTEMRAWYVTAKKRTAKSKAVVVGGMARRFEAIAALRPPKTETLLHKLRAAIGVIAEKQNLDGPIAVSPIVLLPYGEFQSIRGTVRERRLTEKLRKGLGRFYFRGQLQVECELQGVTYLPEGAGTVTLSEKLSGAVPDEKRLLVFVGGHRNASLLVRYNGGWQGWTSDLGFRKLVQRVTEQVSLPTSCEATLSQAIWEMGDKLLRNHPKLVSIANVMTDSEIGAGEIRGDLVRAIESARIFYWQLLEAWLREVCPGSCARVVTSGGGAFYIEPQLRSFFGEIPLDNASASLPEIEDFIGRNSEGKPVVSGYRFSDTYGLARTFLAKKEMLVT